MKKATTYCSARALLALLLAAALFGVRPASGQETDTTRSTERSAEAASSAAANSAAAAAASSGERKATRAPKVRSFATEDDQLGAVANSVNLFTGDVALPITLVSLPGRHGLGASAKLSYSSMGASEQAKTWNREAPTSVAGLGWSMPFQRIVVDHKRTGTRMDDAYYLVGGGSKTRLVCTDISRGDRGDGPRWTFKTKPHAFWLVHYYSGDERWEITKEDGTTYVYGDKDSGRETVQWSVKWGNWIGASSKQTGQERFAIAWNLSTVQNRQGDEITFAYASTEERVAGHEAYTKASYLKRITGAYGHTATFVYQTKGAAEYQDPHQETSEPDAYQERFKTKYLSRIEVKNTEGSDLFSVRLGYDLMGEGEQTKRLLTSMIHESAEGEALPGYRFTYGTTKVGAGLNEANETYGALMSVQTSSGAKVTYDYETYLPSHSNRSLDIAAPSGYSQPRVWVQRDYVVVTWRDAQNDRLKVRAYTWAGEWVEKHLRTIHNIDVGDGRQNFEVYPSEHYFALVTRTYDNQKSDYKRVYLFTRDKRRRGAWRQTSFRPQTGESTVDVVTGERFVTLVAHERGYHYRYVRDEDERGGWMEDYAGGPIDNDDDRNYFAGGTGNYYVFHGDRSGENDLIELHYRDAEGNWKERPFPDDVRFDGGDGNDRSFWHAAPSFVVAVADGINNKSIYIYRWDEDFSTIRREKLRSWDGPPAVYTIANSTVGIYNEPKGELARFDGQGWHKERFHGEYALRGPGASFGADIMVTRREEFGEAYEYAFDANNLSWNRRWLECSPPDHCSPTVGNGYYVFGTDVYRRHLSGEWEKIEELGSDSGWPSVVFGNGHLAHTQDAGSASPFVVRFFRNGKLVRGTPSVVGDVMDEANSNSDIKQISRLVGPSTYVSFDAGTPLEDARELTLWRAVEEEVRGAQLDTRVGGVEVDDGYQRRFTSYEYDPSSATFASSGLTARYSEVKTVQGSRDASSAPFGYTKTYFFNGLPEEEAAFSFPEGTTGDYGLLTGQSYATQTFDRGGNVVAESNQSFEAFSKDFGGARRAYWVRPTRSTQMRDGVTQTARTDYDDRTGLPSSKRSAYYDSQGERQQTEVTYTRWWEAYDTDRSEHVLTPVAQEKTVTGGTVTSAMATVWTDDWDGNFDDTWAPKATYRYIGDSSSSDADFTQWDGRAAPDASAWLKTRTVTRRNGHGQVIEAEDVDGRPAATVYAFGGQVAVGVFGDARRAEVLAENFDDRSATDGDPEDWYRSGSNWNVAAGVLHWSNPDGSGVSGVRRAVRQQAFAADFDLRILEGSGNDWCGLLFRKKSPSDGYRDSGYMVLLRANGSVELYEEGTRLEKASRAVSDPSRWQRLRVEGKGERIRVFLNGEEVISAEGSSASSGGTYVGFSARGVRAQFDNLRIYPLRARAQTASHDRRTKRQEHQTGPRGERVYTSFDGLGRALGTAGPGSVPHQTTASYRWNRHQDNFDPEIPHQTLQTTARGTEGVYENFEQGGLLRWTEQGAGNEQDSQWRVAGGRLIHSSPNGITDGTDKDGYFIDLGTDLTGRVAVELSVRATTPTRGLNFGVALGDGDWSGQWQGGSAVWTLFKGHSRWASSPGGSIASGLEAGRTYRLKIVADTDAGVVDYYLDGRLLAGGRPFQSPTEHIRKVGLVSIGQAEDPTEWRVDEVMVYTDPVHQAVFTDNAGRTRQTQREEEDGVVVTEMLYDKAGRAVVQTKATRISGATFGYRSGFVGDGGADGTFAEQFEAADRDGSEAATMSGEIASQHDAGGYPYGRTAFEASPLSRKVATYLPGSSSQTHPVTYRYDANGNNGLRDDLPGSAYYRQAVTDPDGHTSVTLATTRGETATKAYVDERPQQETEYEHTPRQVSVSLSRKRLQFTPNHTHEADWSTTYSCTREEPCKNPPCQFKSPGSNDLDRSGEDPEEESAVQTTNAQQDSAQATGTRTNRVPGLCSYTFEVGTSEGGSDVVSVSGGMAARSGSFTAQQGQTYYLSLTYTEGPLSRISVSGQVRYTERQEVQVWEEGQYSQITSYEYEERGNTTRILPPNFHAPPSGQSGSDYVTTSTYDARGRLKARATPDAGTERVIYGRAGRKRFAQDGVLAAEGQVAYWKYDEKGRLIEKGIFTQSWDRSTLESKAEDRGWPASPATWRQRVAYGGFGDPLSAHGRPVKAETNSDADAGAEAVETYAYDRSGNLTAITQNAPGFSGQDYATRYQYDNTGAPTRTIYPTGALTLVYTYDRSGRLESLGTPDDTDFFARYTYTAGGAVAEETLKNGALERGYTYGAAGRLTRIAGDYFEEELQYTSGGYEDAGYHSGLIARARSVHKGTDGSVTDAFATRYKYDKLGRLQVADNSAHNERDLGVSRRVAYDPNGNIQALSRGGQAKTFAYYEGTNRLKSTSGGGTDYGYDARGAVTSHATRHISQLRRDMASGRPMKITYTAGGSERTTRYQYGPDGERLVKEISQSGKATLYLRGAGGYPLAEVERDASAESGGRLKLYVRGPTGLIAFAPGPVFAPGTYATPPPEEPEAVYYSGEVRFASGFRTNPGQRLVAGPNAAQEAERAWRFVLKDHLGSTRVMVGPEGASSRTDYLPFGGLARQTAGGSVSYLFTGQELDDGTGLFNFRARLYDPAAGRFLSMDPAGQFHSPYVYGANNPVVYIDPNGEIAFSSLLIGAGAAAGTAWLFTSNTGYEVQKYVSPVAVKFDVHFSTEQRGLGLNASVGVPKLAPLSYRAHVGATYYWGYYDGSYTGWETRYGGEWTVAGVVSYSGTTFSAGENSQTTNMVTLGVPGLSFKYENDYFWGIGEYLPGVPASDGGDRFRTAAAQLQVGFFKVGLNLFTGDPGLLEGERQTDEIDGEETYVEGPAGDPDKYRAGVLYFGVGPFRIGGNSEGIRNFVQNKIVHDLSGSPDFLVQEDIPPRWYFYFGTGTGNTLW